MFEEAGPNAGRERLAPSVAASPAPSYPEVAARVDGLDSAAPAGAVSASAEADPRAARHAAADEIMALSSKMATAHGRIVEILAEQGGGALWPRRPRALAGVGRGHEAERGQGDRAPGREITAALSTGEISFDKAATIARVANADNEEALVQWARNGTVSQLASITSGYLKVKASDDGRDGAHLRRHLSYFYTEDGAFRLRAQMSADQGAVVARAIDAAADQLFEEQKTFTDHGLSQSALDQQNYTRADHRGARQADALVSLAEAFLENGLADDRAAERYKVLVHVDQAALTGDVQATSELEDGAGISHHSALRLSCDSPVRALLEGDGVPLELGRERRVVSPALRRALEARDRCCVFPGCSARRRLDAHHLRHWVRDGGKTEPDNLSLLCRRHHRLMHEVGYSMTFDGRVARFFRPDGSEIERVPKWDTVTEAERYEWIARDDFDYDAWAHWIDDFDLNEAVAYLLRADSQRHPPPEAPAPDHAFASPTGSSP